MHTVHNVLPHEHGERFRTCFSKLYQKADALICHSDAAKTRVMRDFHIDGSKIWVIPHGPLFDDLASEIPEEGRTKWAKDAERLVVCHGIIRPYKGIPFLLDAWKLVESSNAAARLIVAGLADRNYANELMEQSRHLGLKQVQFEFRFLDPEEMVGLLMEADVLVYPYRDITTSGALMTGIAHGKPIVATDLPPFRQTLQKHQSAFLVPYGDANRMAQSLLTSIGSVNSPHSQSLTELSAGRVDEWVPIARHTRACYEWALMRGTGQQEVSRIDAFTHQG